MRRAAARLTVLAMSTSHTYTQRNTQLIPSYTHQTSADTAAAATQRAPFSLRPMCISDREGLRTLFARLSPESRRRRFLTGKPELSARELTYLTDVDHVRHEALSAIDPADGSIVGVARYATWPGRAGAADVAIEVADDLHRNGVGLMLAEALIRRARENGIIVLTATTLWENHAARSLARRVGFRARASAGNELELELQLPPAILDRGERHGDDGQSGRPSGAHRQPTVARLTQTTQLTVDANLAGRLRARRLTYPSLAPKGRSGE